MARIPARAGRVYMGLTSAGTAEPVAFVSNWSVNFTTNKIDVTAMGDTTKVYVSSLPDCQGTFSGFYDNATVQAYTASTDGIARKFYLYPDLTGTPGQYWYGTAIFDMSIDGSVDGAVAVSGSFAGASVVTKIG